MIIGTGETSELAARALADSGVRDRVRRQPPPRPRDQPGPALRRRQRSASTSCRRRSSGPTSSSPRPPRRTCCSRRDELAEVMAARAAGRPLLLIDLAVPRDIDAACARARRRLALRHRRPAGGDRAQPQGPPGRGAQGRGDHRGGDPAASRAWLGSLEVLPTLAALRSRADEIAEQVVRENDGKWEIGLARATSSASRRSPGRSSTGCCTSRRCG